MKVLILDDSHERLNEFKKRMLEAGISNYDMVEDAASCIDKLQNNQYDIIFLDHDLGGEVYVSTDKENTGSGVARWMRENANNVDAQIIFHSLNEKGRDNMKSLLEITNECHNIPFVWTKDTFHHRIG